MVFSSTVFLFLFLPAAWMLYFNPLCKSRRSRNSILLVMSLLFYAWGEPVFVFVMMLSILVNWFLAIRIDDLSEDKKKKRYVLVAVIWNLGLLFVFKYLTFVIKNIGLLIGGGGISVDIALPIGISFFTFQILSYVLDVYYGNATVQKNVLDVALYVSMFPQLIAGPIVRYSVVADEIKNRRESLDNFVAGFERFIIGLAKKALLANYIAIMVDNIFLMDTRSVATAWLGAVGYTLQIYFDFSGYSDMAIGLGRTFGFHFNENFNYPYISKTVAEFWRRWHISLSSWLRDYVYIPLGGNRKGTAKKCRNLLITFTLSGVWHGANWTFIFWGFYYGVLLSIGTLVKNPIERINGRLHIEKGGWFDIVRLIRTFAIVCIGYVFFRSDNMHYAWQYLKGMFGVGAVGIADDVFAQYVSNAKFVLICGLVGSTPVIKWIHGRIRLPEYVYGIIETVCMAVLAVVSVFVCIKSTYNPFIYFNF
jgi:D-alanyl-lipoteichoic acid acyltransferase DltB (MBOAT superfamily)